MPPGFRAGKARAVSTAEISASAVNGLARKSMPASRTPSRTMPMSVWPDMYKTRRPGWAAVSFVATSRPLMPGILMSVRSSCTAVPRAVSSAAGPSSAVRTR